MFNRIKNLNNKKLFKKQHNSFYNNKESKAPVYIIFISLAKDNKGFKQGKKKTNKMNNSNKIKQKIRTKA